MDIPTKSNNLSFNPINIGIDIYPLRKKGVFDIELNKGNMGIQGEKHSLYFRAFFSIINQYSYNILIIYSYNF